MEFYVPVNNLLRGEITKITHTLLPPGFHGDNRLSDIRTLQNSLIHVIDSLGEQSAIAQGLTRNITTSQKLRNSPNHTLYLLKDSAAKGGNGEVVALLKVGRKHLYLFDEHGTVREVDPLCVLDFYVKSDRQRHGLGKRLFDHMLQEENIKPEHLAIDGPSPKMESFLRKIYGVELLLRQSNNFAVSPQFFKCDHSPSAVTSVAPESVSVGRFTAPKPTSSAGSIIHGGGSYEENSRGSSGVNTPELIAVYTSEPEFFAARPQVESLSPIIQAKSRSSLQLDPEHEFAPASQSTPDRSEDECYSSPESPQLESQFNPERPTTLKVDSKESEESGAPRPAGLTPSRRPSQLTDQGHFDIINYHNKLW